MLHELIFIIYSFSLGMRSLNPIYLTFKLIDGPECALYLKYYIFKYLAFNALREIFKTDQFHDHAVLNKINHVVLRPS